MDAKKEEVRKPWGVGSTGALKDENIPPSGRDCHQMSTLGARNKRKELPSLWNFARWKYELLGDEPEPDTQFESQAIKASGAEIPHENSRRHSQTPGSKPTSEHHTSTNATATAASKTGPSSATRCFECSEFTHDGILSGLFDLTDYIKCHACNVEHRSVEFTPSQRDATVGRTCIARQGFRTLCPHWRISLSDIRLWQRYMDDDIPESCPHITRSLFGFITVKCPHEAHSDDTPESQRCPFSDLTLELSEAVRTMFVTVKWTSSLKQGVRSEDRFETCKKIIGQLNELCPEAFGPPIMTPRRIQLLTRNDLNSSGKLTINVDRCLDFDYIDLLTQGRGPPTVSYVSKIRVPKSADGDQTGNSWSGYLDPESYGLRDDKLGKGITWCDDVGCATMGGRLQREVIARRIRRCVHERQFRRDYFRKNPSLLENLPEMTSTLQQDFREQFHSDVESAWQTVGEWIRRGSE
ncbi:uncharacterized protein F5Z01DRAFT_659559 [Emericellopsis atlantica]|uniref:Uncharacterized protein n=1 Tax=Emericellopsis atlantica TaxID=2614577 RepID=A0A9P7ZJH4_9HYPO|nr:uncharacterized protein F5Z01DRAFT_659559 [Emericellopsis atlantica]KAG9252827.1 hypothetical protein F5Z01DRAFT_659559 [Emericellopsis atlantica]